MTALRFRIAQKLVRRWPLPVGRTRFARAVVGGEARFPDRADIDFRFGTFLDASLRPWPYGFRELWARGFMDEFETHAWLTILKAGDTVIDGGANYGYWSLVANSVVGPRGRVVAVEAMPDTADRLVGNLQASRAHAVDVVRAALSDVEGRVTLHAFENDPFAGRSSIGVPAREKEVSKFEVAQTTLDLVAARLPKPPVLVKLDVEGSELRALGGARGLLSSDTPPIVTFEWNETMALPVGWHPKEALAFLREHGYGFFLMTRKGFVPFEVRRDVSEWSPMVWAFKGRAHSERVDGIPFRRRP